MDFYILISPRDTHYIVFRALSMFFYVCFQFRVYIVTEKNKNLLEYKPSTVFSLSGQKPIVS